VNCDRQDCENYKPAPAPVDPYKRVFGIKPAPESTEARLSRAGAKVKTDVAPTLNYGPRAWVTTEGQVDLLLYGLTPDQAEAALEVATNGKPRGWCEDCRIRNEAADNDEEVKRLRAVIQELRNVTAAQRDRLGRIGETVARPDGGTKHAADNAIRHADELLNEVGQ